MKPAATPGRLPYWTHADGAREWVAITHGSFGSHEDFSEVAAALAPRYNILSWDLPGHGKARGIAARRSLDALAEDLCEVMDASGVERAHHLGFSFGGMVAQKFVELHPARAASLIAYGCVPIFLVRQPPRAITQAAVAMQLALTPWPKFCEQLANQVTIDPVLATEFNAAVRAAGRSVRDAIWAAMADGARYEPDFAFPGAVAHIMGAHDDRFPHARPAMDMWRARLPRPLSPEILGAGHWVHREKPAQFISELNAVLSLVSARA